MKMFQALQVKYLFFSYEKGSFGDTRQLLFSDYLSRKCNALLVRNNI